MENNTYINVWDYQDPRFPFQIFTGGRGTGKTYSALGGCLDLADFQRPEPRGKFVLMRRTQNELDVISDGKSGDGMNPFKQLNADHELNVGMIPIKQKISGIYNRVIDDDNVSKPQGAAIGYGVALSTIGTIRGIDLQDCTDIIYDEFIPEEHVRSIKGEFNALMNAYETMNRNREFNGLPAMRMFMLSNANTLDNDIFIGLGVVADVERMKATNKIHKYYPERGLAIHMLPPSEAFREKKSKTMLYRLTKGTSFYDMALNNEFAFDDFSHIEHRSLKGYIPFCSYGAAFIYRKKGSPEYYVSYARAKCPAFDPKVPSDVLFFQREYGVHLHDPYVYGQITFESYALKSILIDLIV